MKIDQLSKEWPVWATNTEGVLHGYNASDEEKQKRYFSELIQWSEEEKIKVFWFEAFDVPWKNKNIDGHFGLFFEVRKAKLAVHDFYPHLITSEVTLFFYD